MALHEPLKKTRRTLSRFLCLFQRGPNRIPHVRLNLRVAFLCDNVGVR
jgi:hypothetical protein